MPLGRFRFAASREKCRAKSPPIETTAARAICGLEQVRTISRTGPLETISARRSRPVMRFIWHGGQNLKLGSRSDRPDSARCGVPRAS